MAEIAELTARLFDLDIDPLTMEQVVDRCRNVLATRTRLRIGVVNAAKIVSATKDADLRSSLVDCDLILADGQSVVWASRLLGNPLPERVAGIDLFQALLELSDRERRSIYLLGARPEVLEALVDRLSARYPAMRIAGVHDGYFADDESGSLAEGIRASKADMLFLGMSSPRKENFLRVWGDTLDVPIMHGVGGSFDVFAGITKRAPARWQRMGIEWLYRLLQEPRRMWRRYLTTNSQFVVLLLQELTHCGRRTGHHT